MAEIGRIGQKRWNGVLYEEFLRDLQGIRGVEVYREMANNDDTIGAILFAIKMLIRHILTDVEVVPRCVISFPRSPQPI